MNGTLRRAVTTSILAVLLLGAMSALAVPARATPPLHGGGSFDISIPPTPGTIVMQPAGRNLIVSFEGGGGNMEGTVAGKWIRVYERSVIHPTGVVTVQGAWVGDPLTVDGVSGTIHVRYWGQGDVVTGDFEGRWVILSGTDGLANLRGHGTVWVDEGVGGYTLEYHFDP